VDVRKNLRRVAVLCEGGGWYFLVVQKIQACGKACRCSVLDEDK
jgi:hypothetical protein